MGECAGVGVWVGVCGWVSGNVGFVSWGAILYWITCAPLCMPIRRCVFMLGRKFSS